MTLNKSSVLFLGRKNDECCNKAYIFLKKNFSTVKVIWSKSPNEKNHLYFKKEFDYIFSLNILPEIESQLTYYFYNYAKKPILSEKIFMIT